VVAWAGQGVHGVIFQAVRIGQEDAGLVALKLALLPDDPRLAREVAVLSRADHPSVPRLLDSGVWQHPGGTRHPFLVVEWVHSLRNPQARFAAGPADDVYALGVTACRLVTGEYPQLGEPYQDADGRWHLESVVLPHALRDEGHAAPPLRELILRMLSVLPEERGTAAELATLLERAAEHLEQVSAPPSLGVPPAPSYTRGRVSRIGLAAVALALGAGIFWGVSRQAARQSFVPGRAVAPSAPADEGTTGLGDTASRVTQGQPGASWPEAMSEDTLPEPLPGQLRPDAKGRCPGKQQVALNGACWLKASWEREECEVARGQTFNGVCYVPYIPPGRQPTSDPP
jgi:hypothetical protein